MHSLQLNKLILVEQSQVSKGSSGGMVKSWVPLLPPLYAAIRHLSGNEKQVTTAAGGQVGFARTEFRIRFRSGIETQMRIRHRGLFYNINHVNPLAEGGDWLILTCDTGVNDG